MIGRSKLLCIADSKGEAEPSPSAVKQLFLLEAVEARLALAVVRLEESVAGAGPGLDSRERDLLQVSLSDH